MNIDNFMLRLVLLLAAGVVVWLCWPRRVK